MNETDTHPLQALLAALKAAQWLHWTGHWQVATPAFYGDHLLLERVYGTLAAQIDDLAEKMVANGGPELVDPATITEMELTFVKQWSAQTDPIVRSLHIEEILQGLFKQIYELMKSQEMSLGMDDFLMGLANEHEVPLYLLRQRTR